MANKRQIYEVNENKRLINELPDEIGISSILSRLTIREVARTRLVSRHWNRIYHHISSLNFENSRAMQNLRRVIYAIHDIDDELLDKERRSFINWVDHVLENHMGSCIDQFKVTFDFDKTYQSHIDIWVIWALSKHVKILDLDFSRVSIYADVDYEQKRYFLHQSLLERVEVKPFLTCLCLKSVNVTTQVVEHLLESCCSTLENLCIENSLHLSAIRIKTSLQSLKYFKVLDCTNLDTIDISAPKLLSFTYESGPESGLRLLHITNASSLTRVSIEQSREDHLVHALGTLSNYFSCLEYLKLRWFLCPEIKRVINNNWPVLANLKHLELCVNGFGNRSLLGWIPLIEACSILQKLTLQLHCSKAQFCENIPKLFKRDKHPLRCLKTLEIIGFVGSNVDLDVVNYVFENGIALQEVVLQPRLYNYHPNLKIPSGALQLKIPRGVKLLFISSPKISFY